MNKIIILEIIFLIMAVFCLFVIQGKINIDTWFRDCTPLGPSTYPGGPLYSPPAPFPCALGYARSGLYIFGFLSLLNLALLLFLKTNNKK